jgi:serine/threonine-protein kinase
MADRQQNQGLDPTPAPDRASASSATVPIPVVPAPGTLPTRLPAPPSATPGGIPGTALTEQPTRISDRPPIADPATGEPFSSSAIARALSGRRLLHFEIEQFVGGGGMGAVFRGRDSYLNRTVAVKVLSQDILDEDTIRRFQNEAQSAARLHHPNIPAVYFVGQDEGWHFIVFEFVEGQNIRDIVAQRGPLPVPTSVCFLAQLAAALQHASGRDVVHRDIKPSNVVITPDGQAKLVDMGLARLDRLRASGEELTATGVTLGTFDYISPEQARDPRTADVRSDIYSLGCTVYFMLTGRPPFPDGTVLQKLLSHTSDAPPDPRQFRSEIPEALCRVVGRMLAKQPEDRFQNADELLGEVLLLSRSLGVTVPDQMPTVVVESRPATGSIWQRHVPWLVPLLILVATAVGLDLRTRSELPSIYLPPPIPGESASLPRASAIAPERVNGDGAPAGVPDAAQTPPAVASQSANASPQATERSAANAPAAARMSDVSSGGDAQVAPLPTSPPPSTPLRGDGNGPLAAAEGATHVVVGDQNSRVVQGGSTRQAADLRMAIEMMQSSPTIETIEIRRNGSVQLDPLQLSDRRLTIRAAAGYTPQIVFRPRVDDRDPSRAMFDVAGGKLRLEGLEVVLEPPRIPGRHWVLFRLQRPTRLELEACVVTLKFPPVDGPDYRNGLAVFESRSVTAAGPAGGETTPGGGAAADLPLEIGMRDCVVRGQADLLNAAGEDSVQLTWTNGLLVTTDRLLALAGHVGPAPASAATRISLSHVTAVMQRGLALVVTDSSRPTAPRLDLRLADSILVTDHEWPLLEQRGPASLDNCQAALTYHGERNFFQGMDVFWQIDKGNPPGSTQPGQLFDFDQWQDHWRGHGGEPYDVWDLISWFPQLNRPAHAHRAEDYRLTSPASRAAAASGLDGSTGGALLDRLPAPWRTSWTAGWDGNDGLLD